MIESTFKVVSILGDYRPLLGGATFLTFPIFGKKKSIFENVPMFPKKRRYVSKKT
jgi:hypothetical protein